VKTKANICYSSIESIKTIWRNCEDETKKYLSEIN